MQNPIVYLVRRAWAEARGYRPVVISYVLMFLCAQGLLLAEPWVVGRLLDAVQTSKDSAVVLAAIYRYAGIYLAIQVFFWAFHGPARVLERWVAFHVEARFRTTLFHQVTQLPLQWQRDNHSGEIIDKISRAAGSLHECVGGSFMVIYMVLRLVGAQVLLFVFMPTIGVVTLATTFAVLWLIFRFDRVLYDQYGSINQKKARAASALHDYVTNMITVITLRLEERVFKEVRRRIDDQLPIYQQNIVVNELKWFTTNVLIGTMVATVLSWYAYRTLSLGQVLLGGTFYTLFEYLRRIGESFYNFAALYGSMVRWSADLRGADLIVNAYDQHGKRDSIAAPPAGRRELAVSGLDFVYEDEKKRTHHLDGVNLKLGRGQAIAFVGASGSGKTTCLTLLRGLHKPGAAQLLADGVALPSGLSHLAAITTLMPQDPEIFADTIRFNITFGMDAPEEQVLEALRIARFDSVLARLEKGLDTNIAEKGVNLSGGEKQRLALARGVFFSRDSQLVLMDEPTSSVDTANERQIYSALLALGRDRCMVSAIHKLHLLPLFDRIYVFDDGKIVEEGRFDELVARGGPLAVLWQHYQASRETESGEVAAPLRVA